MVSGCFGCHQEKKWCKSSVEKAWVCCCLFCRTWFMSWFSESLQNSSCQGPCEGACSGDTNMDTLFYLYALKEDVIMNLSHRTLLYFIHMHTSLSLIFLFLFWFWEAVLACRICCWLVLFIGRDNFDPLLKVLFARSPDRKVTFPFRSQCVCEHEITQDCVGILPLTLSPLALKSIDDSYWNQCDDSWLVVFFQFHISFYTY